MSARTYGAEGTKDRPSGLRATRDRLELALENSRKGTEPAADADGADVTSIALKAADLLKRAEPGASVLGEWLTGTTSIAESQEELDDLRLVIDEATDLLETVDISALPDTIALTELPSAIDHEAVPGAIIDREPTAPVDFGRLAEIVELKELLRAIDFRALLKEKAELDDALSHSLAEQEKRSEAASEENEDDPALRKGLRRVYEKIDDVSDTSQSGANAFAGSKRSTPTPPTYSTVPSKRPDIRGTSRFSTVPDR